MVIRVVRTFNYLKIRYAAAVLCSLLLSACGSSIDEEPLATPSVDSESKEVVDAVVNKPSITLVGDANAQLSDTVSSEEESSIADSFRLAIEKSQAGQIDQAADIYRGLISEYPKVIESYVNLAALYADQGELDKATKAINEGVSQNPRSAVVFEALKKLNGAVAANAYRSALNEKEKIDKVHIASLASLSESSMNQVERYKLEGFEQRLAKINDFYGEKLQESRRAEIAKQKEVTALQQELQKAQAQIGELKQSSAVALRNTRTELEQQLLVAQERAEQDLKDRARTVGSLNTELISVRNELEKTQELLAQATKENQELVARAVLADRPAPVVAAVVEPTEDRAQIDSRIDPVSLSSAADDDVSNVSSAAVAQPQTGSAIATVSQTDATTGNSSFDSTLASQLVKSWAQAWSNQDVEGYINHYRIGYTPPRKNISHTQWKQQRKVRLTNKRFIDVQVSEFDVKDLGDTFAVTFRQHYRSNTLDDKILKRLVFAKDDSQPRNARIIDEIVL
jgi:tetratricopeptide (TPR) repeat protein